MKWVKPLFTLRKPPRLPLAIWWLHLDPLLLSFRSGSDRFRQQLVFWCSLFVSALLAWSLVRPAPAPVGTVTRLSFILPEGDVMGITDGMAISPDGRLLVYAGERDGTQQLFVRPRDQMTVRPLGGTEGARHPFFSPEGAWVGLLRGRLP